MIEILLVEDSPTDALLIGEALADIGEFEHRLTHAELLADALAHTEATRFDVVLLDLGLPDAQGIATFQAFHCVAPDVPVLVLTGLDDTSVGFAAIQEGAQDYLLKKAIEAPVLARAIRYAIERHRAAAALRASREELQRLSTYIEHIREEEKTRIARELHDDLGQLLTALKMETTQLDRTLQGAGVDTSGTGLRNVYGIIDQLVSSVRRIAADLRPVMLDDLGPVPAIDWFIHEFSKRHGVVVNATLDPGDVAFNRTSGTEVFRMVQEALTNIARHSGATEASVSIARVAPHCIVRIADNGHGMPEGARPGRNSFGLLGMRERAARLGGSIEIDTGPARGFALTITLPLAEVEKEENG
ncbi:Histidine kinase-, DNA gyrase B-, and HSP90-like ATPase [Trinickia caryophylli]|uniref:Histidine kinase-, DNA gyrase B-, and HSP90-like ATPase n=1 Tax=Trinickia caryophylli TaxID=28094 RepID=A0A1X7CZD2_TRICW|nr:Histidine kinase-, DNA gyrase B-, and HSP90-like ATPase [Trinickia caryophylli]